MRLTPYDTECLYLAKEYIDVDMTRHYTITEIAKHAGLNTTKLRTGFKKLFGMGLYHYLKEQRLQKGKYLLENTYKPLKDISHALGYKHTCNFITAFRKRFGKSPGTWRSQILFWLTMIMQNLQQLFCEMGYDPDCW